MARVTHVSALYSKATLPRVHATQVVAEVAYGPPASKDVRETQSAALISRSAGEFNVTAEVTQLAVLAAYSTNQPAVARQSAWTFVMDGHRFYVLPLGEEGDWAYDTTTQEWCQLQSLGFDGLNFTHGVMWGLRVMGGDSLYPYLYEFDPTQPLDEEWRQIERIVTGGIATRGRNAIGVANFTLTASVDDVNSIGNPISLSFSDDNGETYSQEFNLPLTDMGSQQLIWNALGSFEAPGRIFRITDMSGPVRFDGADVVLSIGDGADSGTDQEGQKRR
jgi:hypothetical protein